MKAENFQVNEDFHKKKDSVMKLEKVLVYLQTTNSKKFQFIMLNFQKIFVRRI